MVEVEIRSPVYDEEASQVEWRRRALVRAEGTDLVIYTDGEGVVLPDDLLVLDLASGAQLRQADDPENWARNLPHAYRNGDLVAVVLVDTDAASTRPAPERGAAVPSIPAPPEQVGVAVAC
ncbi:MAG TPA: hypothetical protein VF257_10525 [Solirubrobacteraceae bacterium]